MPGAEFGKRRHGGKHRCAAGHVGLHVFHFLRGLYRDPAAVKGDPFADQGVQGIVFAGLLALDAQKDELGRLIAAAADREQRVHAQLLHVIALEDLDIEPRPRPDGQGLLREPCRRQDIRRLVAQGAGHIDGVADNHTLTDRLLRLKPLRLSPAEENKPFQVPGLDIAGLVDLGFVVPKQRPFRGYASSLSHGEIAAQEQGDGPAACLACLSRRGAGNLPQTGRIEVPLLARADQEQPPGFQLRRAVDETAAVQFRLEFAAGQHGSNHSLRGLVQRLQRRPAADLIFKYRVGEQIARDAARVPSLEFNLHPHLHIRVG